MKLFDAKQTCSGCGACASVCSKHAIEMRPDENGFVYPHIDQDRCVNCNLCVTTCYYQKQKPNPSEKRVFAAVSNNSDISESASGGLFSSFAKEILATGGVVYGSALQYYDNNLHVKHIKVTSESELYLLKGSKYVHSDTQNIFLDVLTELKKGSCVLFSGTPCQISGLKGFLKRDYPNLFTIDIICHGVPSEQLFQQYISFEERKYKSKITDFRFRDKTKGWKLYGSMTLENGQCVFFEPENSSYYQMFLNSYTYRENCYSCPYASEYRPGDITIGDYWCIDLIHPEYLIEHGGEIDPAKGVSCMIVNNKKGLELLSLFGIGIKTWPSSYENAAKYNRQLSAPSSLKEERKIVLDLAKRNYDAVDKWYRKRLIPIKIVRNIRAAIPKPIKSFIKKMIK